MRQHQPPGILADLLDERSVCRGGQRDDDDGLRSTGGEPPRGEAITANVEHDDPGHGGKHDPRDQAATTPKPHES